MKKFNGHESFMIQEGLKLYAAGLKAEIKEVEDNGRNAFMTQGFVDISVSELNDKVKEMTRKEKK